MNPKYELYHADAKVLLTALQKDIVRVGKTLAKERFNIVIPSDVEVELFGGEISLEAEVLGKIGGLKINAIVDCLIELDPSSFVIRDFKSYERDTDDDPMNQESKHHRAFMQICLYAIIFEKVGRQQCKQIQLEYFPNKTISYEFSDKLRKKVKQFALDTAFEGFEGVSLDLFENGNGNNDTIDKGNDIPQDAPVKENGRFDGSDKDVLGYIYTVKGKPLELVMGGDNKMEGYLYPNKAYLVKDGYCVVVEKEEDGVRIMNLVKKIECSEDHYPGETSSHKEENFKITLIPMGQFTPEGFDDLRPQTIIGGKIKIPSEQEFCAFKKIPQNGMQIGNIQGLNMGVPYPLELKTLYQSVFMSGQQGTGKTSSLKLLVLQIAQHQHSPAQILLDNEGEYGDLINIPSTKRSGNLMAKNGISRLIPDKFNHVDIGTESGYCLTLKAIDPVDLPYFLHELTPISHDTLQSIIYDIVEDNTDKEFAFPELKKHILKYLDKEKYGAGSSTKSAIKRAMISVSLRIFDVPGKKPIDFESMLKPGTITVINSYNLRDSHQRIVGLYLLAILHARALKAKEMINVLFYLDEVQRLVPKSKSQSDSEYLKRIITFLEEVVHRGRKRDYGVVFATQSVMDVKKAIIDLCNTKLFFQTQGSGSSYLKEYFSNREDITRLKRLPRNHAFITCKGKHEPVEIKFQFIN
jgi:hypothetical protein